MQIDELLLLIIILRQFFFSVIMNQIIQWSMIKMGNL